MKLLVCMIEESTANRNKNRVFLWKEFVLNLSESCRFVFVYIRVRCEGIESFISIMIVKLSFDRIYLEI